MRRMFLAGMRERRKNRRTMLALYSDGSWKIVTKQLVRDAEGKPAISRRELALSDHAMGAVLAMYVKMKDAAIRMKTEERARES